MANDNMKTFVNPMMNQLWDDISPGFYNYGRLDPDVNIDETNLTEANENMSRYVIDKLGITEDSTVLDIGCGTGMYCIHFAKITGCTFLGFDACEDYVKKSNDRAKEYNVEKQGEFINGSYRDLPEKVLQHKFTHVVALGSFMYAQKHLDQMLPMIEHVCTKDVKFLIWDQIRTTETWQELESTVNRHLKLSDTCLITEQEYRDVISSSPFTLYQSEDVTKYIIPGYQILCKECEIRDPGMEVLTYPIMRDAFLAGKLKYIMFYCQL